MDKVCGNIVSWLRRGKTNKDENHARLILLHEKMNMLRWANLSLALNWEEEIFKRKFDIAVGVLKNLVSATPDYRKTELDSIAKLIGYDSAYELKLQGFVNRIKTYRANRKSSRTKGYAQDGSAASMLCERRLLIPRGFNMLECVSSNEFPVLMGHPSRSSN
ncbi:uncharacterized protein V1513DRAFT_428347 [Lipomyces chichibuensis]|uniref:uncharacterized protein n=1 Tax=Lipomyces chichibuensis TaxID=1546026 RepID=UPI003343AEFF